MKLEAITVPTGSESTQIATFVDAAGARTEVYFRCKYGCVQSETFDHFFLVGALAAFLRGEPYQHKGPVSPKLLSHFHQIMEQWKRWWKIAPVSIAALTPPALPNSGSGRKTGALMSGGADSLFTAMTMSERISTFVTLIHTRSLEPTFIEPSNAPMIHAFAEKEGKSVIWVETNVMHAFPEIEDAWSSLSHGACMAAVGHFLSGELSDLLVSSSFAHHQLRPWGSHPAIDPLLSSETLSVEHVGLDFNRFQKHLAIAENKDALSVLSVCERGPQLGEHVNCSRCQKCLRSMITLDLLSVDHSDAPTFDWDSYKPERLRGFLLQGHVNCSELLAYAEEIGREDISVVLRDTIAYAAKYHWIINAELYLRRKFSRALRYKNFLKRVRFAAYRLLKIRTRHSS